MGYDFIQFQSAAIFVQVFSSSSLFCFFQTKFEILFHLNLLPFNFLGVCYQKAEGVDDEEEVLDEDTKKKDLIVKGAIDGLTREYAAELNAPSQDEDSQRRKRKKEKKEEVYLLYFFFFFLVL